MNTAAEMVAELNRVLGEGTVKLGNDPSLEVQYLPTGVLPIDYLLQGGLPRGRFTEFYGDYSTLKSFVALRAIAETQKAGGVCGIVDTEHAYDPEWLRALGGDPDTLIVERPDNGEKAVEVIEVLVRSGVDLIVWDSIAATLPKAEQEKRATEDKQPARLAQMMSRALRRLNSANKRTAILCINQTRTNVGITFGSSETVPGGKSLPFYASYRIKLAKAGKIRADIKVFDGEKWIGTKETTATKIKATLLKSKLNKPDREVWFTFDLRTAAVDDVGFLINQGLEQGHITVTGGRYKLPSWKKTKHGMKQLKESLTEGDIQWLTDQLTGTSSPGGSTADRSKGGRRKRSS